MTTHTPVGAPTLIPLKQIDANPWQPRKAYDEGYLRGLAESILRYRDTQPGTKGLLQLPAARQVGDRYQLAYGHNRWQAFMQLAAEDSFYTELPVMIGAFSDEEMATMAWSENSARKDLTAIEEAEAIARYAADFGWNDTQVGAKLGLDRSTVAHKRALLKLPLEVQQLLLQGKISERAAKALLPLVQWPVAGAVKWEKTVGGEPGNILAHLAEWTSDRVRGAVQYWINNHSKIIRPSYEEDGLLDEAVFAVEGNILADTCRGCSFRVYHEKQSLCAHTSGDCLAAKRQRLTARRLAPAVEATGIPLLGKDQIDHWTQEGLAVALEPRCENLRLGPRRAWQDQENYPSPPGCPDVVYACALGVCACRRRANDAKQQTRVVAATAPSGMLPVTVSTEVGGSAVPARASLPPTLSMTSDTPPAPSMAQARTPEQAMAAARRQLATEAALKQALADSFGWRAWAAVLSALMPDSFGPPAKYQSAEELADSAVSALGCCLEDGDRETADILWRALLANAGLKIDEATEPSTTDADERRAA